MRHGEKGRKLGVTTAHRHMMARHIVSSLFKHERIVTTIDRAKEFRHLAEKLITRGKTMSLANYRYVLSYIQDKAMVKKLFAEIGPRFKDRNGGYTRIMRLGGSRWSGEKKAGKWASRRLGDDGERAILELVVRPEAEKEKGKKEKKKVASTSK
jgi:large subunit ribosomal protein L17